jgi:hypothetical protein
MPWEDQSHDDSNILLVIPKSEPSDTTTGLDMNRLLSRVKDLFHAEATIFDDEETTTADTEQEDSDETSIQFLSRPEVLEQFAVQVQWKDDWEWPLISQRGELVVVDIETLEPYKYFDPTKRLNASAIFQCRRFITANIEQEDPHKTSVQYYLHRSEILDRFDALAQRKDNWDGYQSKKPTQLTLNHAKFLMEDMLDTIISAEHSWITPFISSDEDGYITAEWYEGERELHIQIGENEPEYLQVWGINIDSEMHEDFLSRDDYLMLWEWLLHE